MADEMGTGKSLTLLALVMRTLDKAREFSIRARMADSPGWERPCSGATLIITPKSSTYDFYDLVGSNVCLRLVSSVQLG